MRRLASPLVQESKGEKKKRVEEGVRLVRYIPSNVIINRTLTPFEFYFFLILIICFFTSTYCLNLKTKPVDWFLKRKLIHLTSHKQNIHTVIGKILTKNKNSSVEKNLIKKNEAKEDGKKKKKSNKKNEKFMIPNWSENEYLMVTEKDKHLKEREKGQEKISNYVKKSSRIYEYMGALNLCTPAEKGYASSCHHVGPGPVDGSLEDCIEDMYRQKGNTINFRNGACWIKNCKEPTLKLDPGQGSWNIYSTLCTNVYDWNEKKFLVNTSIDPPITIPRSPIDFTNRADLDHRSIFVVFATYREKRCVRTLRSMYNAAEYPEHIYVGIFQQHHPTDDIDCLDWSAHCPGDPMCKFKDQVRIIRVHSKESRGPAVARGYAEELYEGEDFTLQVDAHCTFKPDWDKSLKNEFFEIGSEWSVLSTYPKGERSFNDPVRTCPVICNSMIQNTGMLRNDRALEMPLKHYIQPFWAAGLSFSRGHRIVNVPNDKYLNYLFDGEETDVAIRLFTHGYDIYAPKGSYIYHYYTTMQQNKKSGIKKFWDEGNWNFKNQAVNQARRRFFTKLGLENKIEKYPEANNVILDEIERFGTGTKRTVKQWLEFAGINFATHNVWSRCSDIQQGKLKRVPTKDE